MVSRRQATSLLREEALSQTEQFTDLFNVVEQLQGLQAVELSKLFRSSKGQLVARLSFGIQQQPIKVCGVAAFPFCRLIC
jgi:hypothetical protein